MNRWGEGEGGVLILGLRVGMLMDFKKKNVLIIHLDLCPINVLYRVVTYSSKFAAK